MHDLLIKLGKKSENMGGDNINNLEEFECIDHLDNNFSILRDIRNELWGVKYLGAHIGEKIYASTTKTGMTIVINGLFYGTISCEQRFQNNSLVYVIC